MRAAYAFSDLNTLGNSPLSPIPVLSLPAPPLLSCYLPVFNALFDIGLTFVCK